VFTGDRTYTPFSAASHTGSSPKVSSSLAISLPLKMSTSLAGSAHSSCKYQRQAAHNDVERCRCH
jgi:hypothetical protein